MRDFYFIWENSVNIRKIVICFLALFTLWGCSPKTENLFDYQESAADYGATLTIGGEVFDVIIHLDALEGGIRNAAAIEYLSPEEIKGYTVLRRGDEHYSRVGEIDIPVTAESLPQLIAVEALFSLKAEDVSSVDVDGDGNTVVVCTSDGREVTIVYLPAGALSSMETSDGSFSLKFK